MLREHWNSLRIGDRVVVHNPQSSLLEDATITEIEPGRWYTASDLTVVLDAGKQEIHPDRADVHFAANPVNCHKCARNAGTDAAG